MTALAALLLAMSLYATPPVDVSLGQETEQAIQQWWPEETWPAVRCLVWRESGGHPGAVSPGGDYGLLQLRRSVHWRSYDWGRILEIEYNIAAGADLYRGNGYWPWVAQKGVCW